MKQKSQGQNSTSSAISRRQFIRRAGAPVLLKRGSEVPVAFPYTSIMRYAYYSLDGANFYPATLAWCAHPYFYATHDISMWPYSMIWEALARCIYLCNHSDAVNHPSQCWGMAFYAHRPVVANISRRKAGLGGTDFSLMSLTGVPDTSANEIIVDYDWNTVKRIMAVGNLHSVRSVIYQAEEYYSEPPYHGGWGWDG